MARTINISHVVDERKLGGFHVFVIVASWLITFMDGYDISAATYVGPSAIRDWGVKGPDLAILFSTSLIAGFIGPPLLGYFSDAFGRKRAVLGGTIIFGLLTLLVVFADTPLMIAINQPVWAALSPVWAALGAPFGLKSLTTSEPFRVMVDLRFLGSIFIGGVLPTAVALNNEFAPRHLRATLVVLMFTGTTFGGVFPGILTASGFTWPVLFWIGGLVPLAIGVVLLFLMPESLKFLSLRPARRVELATTLRKLQPGLEVSADDQFFLAGEPTGPKLTLGRAIATIFAGRLAALTPLFWITNIVNLMCFYFIGSWTVTLLTSSGYPVGHAAFATALFQFGGTLGGLAIMRPLDKWGFAPVPLLFAIAVPLLALTGVPGLPEFGLMALMFCAGFCLLGLQFGNIGSETQLYPTFVRSWGVASCFAAGRIGAAVGALIGGALLANKVPLQQIFLLFAGIAAIGCVAALVIVPLFKRHKQGMVAAEMSGHAPAPAE